MADARVLPRLLLEPALSIQTAPPRRKAGREPESVARSRDTGREPGRPGYATCDHQSDRKEEPR